MKIKKTIIWDKTCPKCHRLIFENNDVCFCGFSTVKEKTIKIWSTVAFIWLIIFGLLFFVLNGFQEFNSLICQKIEQADSLDSSSVTPAGIQIITYLKNSKYKNYIQTVYVNPRKKNKLMVLIKPANWETMPTEDKKALKQIVLKKWSEIYKNTNPDTKLQAEVSLANFE